jgi:hypothetical protein
MYHGGSQPVGKHSYLNEYTVPRISYDFQAPIREFGQLNASYHRLRVLHLFLQDFGDLLAPLTTTLPRGSAEITPENTEALRYAARSREGAGFLFLNNYQDHVDLPDRVGVRLRLELPGESMTLPHDPAGFTLRSGASVILPFNLQLGAGVLLKSATAQLLTRLQADEQLTMVFFAPAGIAAELALDRATYRSAEVTGGTLREDVAHGYINVAEGQTCRVDITTLDGTSLHLLILTPAQALACWKMRLWGAERLLFSDALPLYQDDELHLSWHGQETVELAFYPPLTDELLPRNGEITYEGDGLIAHYRVSVPEHPINLDIQPLSSTLLRIGVPADALEGVDDAFLSIDYLGDVGHMYLDGRLVSDHFANGQPWEIGLKRFINPGEARELVLRISPLQRNSSALNYFPTGMAFRPVADGSAVSEIHSITALPEYHLILAQRSEQMIQGAGS